MSQPHEPAPTFESIIVELAERRTRDALMLADLLARIRQRRGMRAFEDAEHANLLDEHRQREATDPIIRPMTAAERDQFTTAVGGPQQVTPMGRAANDSDPAADQELALDRMQRVDAHVAPVAGQRWGVRVQAPVDGQRIDVWLSLRDEAATRRLAQQVVDRNDPELVDHLRALAAVAELSPSTAGTEAEGPTKIRQPIYVRRRPRSGPSRGRPGPRGRRGRPTTTANLAEMEQHVRRAWADTPGVAQAVITSPGWQTFARRLDTLRRNGYHPEQVIRLIPVRGLLPDDTTITTAERPAAFATALLDDITEQLTRTSQSPASAAPTYPADIPPSGPPPAQPTDMAIDEQHLGTGIFVDDGDGPYELTHAELTEWVDNLDPRSELDAITAERLYGECGPSIDRRLVTAFPSLTNPGALLSDATTHDRRANDHELDAAAKLAADPSTQTPDHLATLGEAAEDLHDAAAERARAAEERGDAAAPAARAEVTLTPTQEARQRAAAGQRRSARKPSPARQVQPQPTRQPRRTR